MTPASRNETLKLSCPTLAGTIAQSLADLSANRFPDDDEQFLKFHGVYAQRDRDLRGPDKRHIFMVRVRLPGGVMTPAQYCACDDLATRHGNGSLRITSRQGIQFHGVVKSGLGPLVRSINDALMTTLAACGDVVRNVIAPPAPAANGLAQRVHEHARQIAAALAPRTRAYRAIWIEGVQIDLGDEANSSFCDPLYEKTYLPRKFKIGFAIPPVNDTDIFTNCCGFIAIAGAGARLDGYNLLAGGGMGRTHAQEATFPRLADVIGFLPPENVVQVAEAVVTIHRDFGDRADRKHARLKYVIADRGAQWFREELERRLGFKLAEARPFSFERQGDAFGWHRQTDGRLFLGLFVEAGRIKDIDAVLMKSALRHVIGTYRPEVRLTPSNNIILANIEPEHQPAVTASLAAHGIDVDRQGGPLRRASMACVALPTCGLALAEAERFLPELMARIEALLAELRLDEQEIVVRMTGCPNGCARPYTAEIAFVGRGPERYQIWLGGNGASTRLNRLWKDSVRGPDLIVELRPLLARYARERSDNERFGDWCARVLRSGEDCLAP